MLIYIFFKKKIKFKRCIIYFLLFVILNLIILNQYLNKLVIDEKPHNISFNYDQHSSCYLAIITNWSPAYIKPNPKDYINQFSRNLAYSINTNKIFNQNNCSFHIYSIKHYSRYQEHDYYASFVTPIYLNDQPFSIGIQKLSKVIESNNYTSVLIHHHYDVAPNKWQLFYLANNLPLHIKVYFVLHSLPTYPDVEYLGIIRQIAVRATNLIVLTWYSYYSLIHGYGIDKQKLMYIPHGVPLHDKSNNKLLNYNNFFHNLTKNDKVIISSSGLIKSNVEFYRLIRNFNRIQKEIPNLVYLIVGKELDESEPMKNVLKDIKKLNLTGKVIWLDEILDYKELTSLFSIGTAFLSLNDNDENNEIITNLLYAMQHGIPIISTPTRFSTEILTNNRGLIVPFENDTLFTNLVIDFLTNKSLRKIYATNSKEYTKNISWDNISGKKITF